MSKFWFCSTAYRVGCRYTEQVPSCPSFGSVRQRTVWAVGIQNKYLPVQRSPISVKGVAYGKMRRLRLFVRFVRAVFRYNEWGVDRRVTGENGNTGGKKPVQMPLFPPQMSHGLDYSDMYLEIQSVPRSKHTPSPL